MEVIQAIRTKHAVRQFQEKPLPQEAIRAILDAGRRAQSAKNNQPWNFISITNRKTLQELSKCGDFAGHLAGAALGVAILTPPFTERYSFIFDAGQAAAYMQLAAWDLGIGSCPATIYQPEKARQILGYPLDQDLHVIFSFGYPADQTVLTRPNKKGGRKTLEEIVHWERW